MSDDAPFGYTKAGLPRKRAARKGEGCPEKTFTEKERLEIKMMAAAGIAESLIAKIKQVALNTLKKHCAEELEIGGAWAVAQMSRSLFQEGLRGNVTAAIFWVCNKDPDNWRSVQHIRHEGVIKHEHEHTFVDEFRSRILGIASRLGTGEGDVEDDGEPSAHSTH